MSSIQVHRCAKIWVHLFRNWTKFNLSYFTVCTMLTHNSICMYVCMRCNAIHRMKEFENNQFDLWLCSSTMLNFVFFRIHRCSTWKKWRGESIESNVKRSIFSIELLLVIGYLCTKFLLQYFHRKKKIAKAEHINWFRYFMRGIDVRWCRYVLTNFNINIRTSLIALAANLKEKRKCSSIFVRTILYERSQEKGALNWLCNQSS